MNETGARQEYVGLMRAVECDIAHVLHAAHLARQLFDGTAPLHELSADDRELLEAAACLHDLGHTTAKGDLEHHKESARLIRAHPWQHLAPTEIEVVAQVARYHRKGLPSEEHGAFARLAPDDRQRARVLAALLRIADGLDRRHAQFVANVRVEIELERLLLHLQTTDYASHEIRAAGLKANLAMEVFHRRIEFKAELVPGHTPPPSD